MNIQKGSRVELDYDLLDEGGAVVESTQGEGPITYTHGDGEILPGLERALEGHRPGETIEVALAPEDAYGDYDPEGRVVVPKSEFPEDAEIVPGDWVTVHVHHDEEDGPCDHEEGEHEMELRVVSLAKSEIVLDANHPLAGKRVTFRVRVRAVEKT